MKSIAMTQYKKITLKKAPPKPHPWIYKNHIASCDPDIPPGEIIQVMLPDGKSLGIGYYNPASVISIRMLSDHEEVIDADFFKSRINEALHKRAHLKDLTNAFRVVFSEADNLPGLIADLYDNTLVFQLTTLGMDRFRDTVIKAFQHILAPEYIYEKSDMQYRSIEGLKPVHQWHGAAGKSTVSIAEGHARFAVNITDGHKTGFYLDQRKARIAAGTFAKNRRVLDVFCYAGGFSVHAALGNAHEVTAIDIKNQWLDLARENAALNNKSDVIHFVKGDAFSKLQEFIKDENRFDMIIVDPPAFVKNKKALPQAIQGYRELNRLAMRLLSEKGILCTFSCSHHMRNEMFSDMLKESARLEHKSIKIVKRCHQDKDHPIVKTIPETDYLKGYFLEISSLKI